MSEVAGTSSPRLRALSEKLPARLREILQAPPRIEQLQARVHHLELRTAELQDELLATRRALEDSTNTAKTLQGLLEASQRQLREIATAQAQQLNHAVPQTDD